MTDALISGRKLAEILTTTPNSQHGLKWWTARAREMATQFVNLDGVFTKRLPSFLLDGAGDDAGPDNTWPKDAGEFAARWNAEPAEYRELFVSRLQQIDDAAYQCRTQDHAATIANLSVRSRKPRLPFNLARVLNDAVAERERAAQNVADVQESLQIIAEKSPAEVVAMRAELLSQVGLSLIVLEQLDARAGAVE